MLMSEPAGNLVWLSHPRLASMAVSALPAWLWSADATRLLWANPTGAAIFDAPVSAAIHASALGARGPAAIQVARLAATLRPDGATLTERLRGLGAGIGGVLTCACSCITLSDQTRAILVAATERTGDELPLSERVRRLLAQCAEPIAAFSSAGQLIHASTAGRMRLGGATSLAALGAEAHAETARQTGSATGASAAGPLAIERIEAEAATVLMAIFGAAPQRKPSGLAAAAAAPEPSAAGPAASVPAAAGRRAPLRFVWQVDADDRFTIASDEFVALMGGAAAAALGGPWAELAAALGLDSEGRIAHALASRETFSGLCIAWPVGDGGERLRVELSGLPVFDRERSYRGYRGFGICRDVARLAAMAAARRAAPKWTGTATEATAETTIEGTTEAGANVVPLHPAGRPVAPALSPVERSAFQELTRQLHERLAACSQLPVAEGLHANLAQAAPELATPEPAAQEPATQELAAAELPQDRALDPTTAVRCQTERTPAARSDFLAKISHEIRTPLNAIIGFSEMMAQEKFGPLGNERYRQYLADIQSSGAHLLSLVNDLLDLSRIEAGRLELDFTAVPLNPLTQQCVAILQQQANRERILIRTALSPRLPPVNADARSVHQIVLNLLANSTRLAGAGGQVIVSTTRTDAGEVALRVRDSGTGMSEQEIALALAPFRQVATAVSRGAGAAGLGLPLAKALAEANRATFRIRSEPNAGTLIEVSFPPDRVAAEERR
jgi:signal transduction histidine kinase